MTGDEPGCDLDGFTVPDAPSRPGEEAHFEPWTYTPEDLSQPDPKTCTSEDTTDHAEGLIRVLDDEGVASGARPEEDDIG